MGKETTETTLCTELNVRTFDDLERIWYEQSSHVRSNISIHLPGTEEEHEISLRGIRCHGQSSNRTLHDKKALTRRIETPPYLIAWHFVCKQKLQSFSKDRNFSQNSAIISVVGRAVITDVSSLDRMFEPGTFHVRVSQKHYGLNDFPDINKSSSDFNKLVYFRIHVTGWGKI